MADVLTSIAPNSCCRPNNSLQVYSSLVLFARGLLWLEPTDPENARAALPMFPAIALLQHCLAPEHAVEPVAEQSERPTLQQAFTLVQASEPERLKLCLAP